MHNVRNFKLLLLQNEKTDLIFFLYSLKKSNNEYTLKRYKRESSAPHISTIIIISIEPAVDHCCKNCSEMG